MQKNDPLAEKTMNLAIRAVKLGQYLRDQKGEFVLSKQLVRCGTNPGAMVREAVNAEIGNDFVHKLGIAQKETGEFMCWIELLQKTGYINEKEFDSLSSDATEVMLLVRSSILTKKKNMLKK